MNYRLFDTKEKQYLNSMNYVSLEHAEEDKAAFLADGNYPDDPHTVIAIHQFENNAFIKDVTAHP